MNLDHLRSIAKQRTKPGTWEQGEPHPETPDYCDVHETGSKVQEFIGQCVPVTDAPFIVLADRMFDALLDVAEASRMHLSRRKPCDHIKTYYCGWCEQAEALARLREIKV